MPPSDPRARATIVQLITWLVAQDYEAIERTTNGVRLSATALRNAVSEYGRRLIMPPDSALDHLDDIEVVGSNPKEWSVRVDLWSVEEGRSDLSLECTLVDQAGDLLRVEVDNLHVL